MVAPMLSSVKLKKTSLKEFGNKEKMLFYKAISIYIFALLLMSKWQPDAYIAGQNAC